MRKRKKYLTGKTTVLTIGIVFLLAAMILSLTFSGPVSASELEQSDDRVATELMHEHTDEDCWEKVWVPCGGTWNTSFETSVGAIVYYCSNNRSTEVRNGIVLSTIHSGWTTAAMSGIHDGGYASRINCSVTDVGTFVIEKTTYGGNGILTAYADASEDQVRDVSISFRYPDQSISDKESIPLTQNGIYCAMITWTDVKTGAVRQTNLNYTDISSPVTLIFRSAGKSLFEKTVAYGDMLPEIDLPVRTGYDFLGFYAGDTIWYDSDCRRNEGIRITGSSLEQIVEASYKARTYNVYYGEDVDSNGLKDHVFQATYDEEYGPITVTDVEKEGWIFEGYYWNGEKVFDADGRSTGVWRWDSTGDIVLEAVYRRPSNSSSGNDDSGNQGDSSDGDGNNGSGVTQNKPVSDTEQNTSDITDSVSDNSSVNQNFAAADSSGSGGNGHGGRNTGSDNGDASADNDFTEDGTEGQRLPGHYSGNLLEDSYLKNGNDDSATGEIDISGEINLLSENMAPNDPIELQRIKNRTVILKAVQVTGITVGVLGLCYLIGWLFVTKFGLAKIYAIQADGTKHQIGDALILKGENAFHVRIKDKVAQKGDTGRYQVTFSKSFVLRHINQNIIIHCFGKNIVEVVRPDINMFIE